MKIIDWIWFGPWNQRGNILVVLCYYPETRKFACYIGSGVGLNAENDKQKVALSGAKMSHKVCVAYFDRKSYRGVSVTDATNYKE